MRFPYAGAVVVDDRNATMRVHRPEFERIETSKLTAGFDMPVLDLELANQPHDLLEVE
jgi:hypothetical protein